ncbi:alcohol dehydrogenase (NADP+) [Angomonas deanei]|uniref:Alcohol dehydrogenase GroES-like domain/Alanine dehydrogenase/PNT, C-terminal domain/Zinc-binding dehydrogenase, putative n=1 Tax=Angomonas deanei TaxID=59799 RepID=A0A7G2CH48_9TRYP|nr:alcohol dehydrogenase (NADP+) [Angomonas deanei]CAD2219150.1 Alcohol dehydrogenase GroES-like domain/Alanine dehydrogenase/PNT, C-terminal domain/Zinc-binding dehydrogenase, putative [Angomonas deanei]|eukprot:EPY41996.1 alcohol dehydrogenase (NADP+) [Angomonas deanei]
MPTECKTYAAPACQVPLAPHTIQRRDVGEDDVAIKVAFCGVCHSDLHQVRDEWGKGIFPMVPGHEIVGHVTQVGPKVTKYKVGDAVGVGCMVDSCRECKQCKRDVEQYCVKGASFTYNSTEQDKTTPTYGGYSDHVVVRERFVCRIPDNLDLCAAAPLLCAGATTFSPLRYWGVKKGTRVGVVGLGGLGHMAVKLAHAMEAEVTVFTTSAKKFGAAKELGADRVVQSTDPEQMKAAAGSLDLIIDTVGMSHDLQPYINTLDIDGKINLVGMPENPHPPFEPKHVIACRNFVGGSNIAGLAETQEMLDFCGKHNVVAEVEKIDIQYINEAYERMLKSDVKYRFVIDIASLHK